MEAEVAVQPRQNRQVKSGLLALVLMQLKDKIDFSFFKSTKKTIFKIVYTILTFVGISALVFLLFNIIVGLHLFSFTRVLNFRLYVLLLSILFVLAFLSCLVNVTNTLYFSKDNQVLLTMPVKSGTIFMSKLIVCFTYELIKNTTYILPFFVAYGLVMKLSIFYFMWTIVSLVFLTLLIVSICGILSIPAMWIGILFRRHKSLEIASTIIVVGALIYLVVYIINLIPADIDLVRDWGRLYWSIQRFLEGFVNAVPFFNHLVGFLSGMGWNVYYFNLATTRNLLTFVNCFATIAVSLGLVILLSRPLFLKMASNPFEYKKKYIKKFKHNKKMRPFISSSFKNAQIIFRTSNLILSVVAAAILMPIAVLFQLKIIGAMSTRILGNYMALAFNILIILLISLSSNVVIASAYSREGNSAYLNKVNPVPYRIPLTGKLVLNALICILSIVASTIIINQFSQLGVFETILLTISLVFVYVAHLLWSAEFDVMNPQNRLYQTTGTNQKNPNETKSTILAFFMSAIFAFIVYFLMAENAKVVFFKVILISLALLLIRIYLYLTKIKLYYKEK